MLSKYSHYLNCAKTFASILIFVSVSHATEFESNDTPPPLNAPSPSVSADFTSHIIVSSRTELDEVLKGEHKPSHLTMRCIPSHNQLNELKNWLSEELSEAGKIHTLTLDKRIFSLPAFQFRSGEALKSAIANTLPTKVKKSDFKVHTLNVCNGLAKVHILTEAEIEVYGTD